MTETDDIHVLCSWLPDAGNGQMVVEIAGLSALAPGWQLALTSQQRSTTKRIAGANLLHRDGSYHVLTPEAPLQQGQTWRMVWHDLFFQPRHSNDGIMSAYLFWPDGTCRSLTVEPLADMSTQAEGPDLEAQPVLQIAEPQLGVTPYPAHTALVGLGPAPAAFRLASPAAKDIWDRAAEVLQVLHPSSTLMRDEGDGALAVSVEQVDMPDDGYRLAFTHGSVTLSHGGAIGALYGLITLLQAAHHGATAPDQFAFPLPGSVIEDRPRYGWRGLHLDVARRFYPIADLHRLLALMCWHKLNQFHWHLTDDEGWRIEIPSTPELVEIGAERGHGKPIPPLLGDDPKGHSGFYALADAAEIVEAADHLGITVVPEIDLPAHSSAALRALPHLVDPNEPDNAYESVHGFANNAINPAMAESFDFVDMLLDTLLPVFPGAVFHVGGDEVAPQAWDLSPRAAGLSGRNASERQAAFMRQLQERLTAAGRTMGGWDECGQGGGVLPDGAVLFAWQRGEVADELAAKGYDIVFCAATACYLDMAESSDWAAPGASWAGHVSLADAYGCDPDAWVGATARLRGVQACIWSELLTSPTRFNNMVFPRLGAVAEVAWSPQTSRDLTRFRALASLLPKLY